MRAQRIYQVNQIDVGKGTVEYFLWAVDPGDVNQQELLEASCDFRHILEMMEIHARNVGVIDY